MNEENQSHFTRRGFLGKAARAGAILTIAGCISPAISGCARLSFDRAVKVISGADFDIIIRNALIYDGTYSDPFFADIGIQADKIAAIGTIHGKAAKTIDAAGYITTPGFIDVHTHCDLPFKRTGSLRYLSYILPSWKGNYNYTYQGVSTVVTGNCGYGYADTDYWLGLVDAVNFGTNVYHLAPHGIIRQEMFGQDQPLNLNKKQLEAMKTRVAEEMQKGAMGLSTGLEYAPGCFSSTDELVELCKVVRGYGGLYTSHTRDESGRIYPDGHVGVLSSVEEAIEIGRRAELPVEISHLKISAPFNRIKSSQVLELIEKARNEGMDLNADQYPYAAGSTDISIFLPNRYKTTLGIKDEYKTSTGREEMQQSVEDVFAYLPPEKILITWYPAQEKYEGKTLEQVSEMQGIKPSQCYVNMVCEEKIPIGVFFCQDMQIVREFMPHDYILTISDGWTTPKGMTMPHPRVYGTFPKKLRKFVLEEKLMRLPQAIRSMTSLPADKFNMQGRGRIAEGAYADIAVIDLNTICDRSTYEDPHQYAQGITYLLVNGVLSIEEGSATGRRGGRALKRV